MSRIIFLEDLENYIEWFENQQLANIDTPQAEIQPSVLETFVNWMKEKEAAEVRSATKHRPNTKPTRKLGLS